MSYPVKVTAFTDFLMHDLAVTRAVRHQIYVCKLKAYQLNNSRQIGKAISWTSKQFTNKSILPSGCLLNKLSLKKLTDLKCNINPTQHNESSTYSFFSGN